MKESKLIRSLKILSATELKGLYTYIRSPYVTKSKDIVRLYDAIRKYAPDFDAPQLEKPKIYQKLFPSKPYSDIKLRNLFAKFHKIIENYLIQLYYEQDQFQKQKLLTKIYKQRNCNVEFKKSTLQLLESMDELPYRDAFYFYESYLLQRQFYFNEYSIQEGKQIKYLEQAIFNLNEFYTIENLRLNFELHNVKQIYKSDIAPKQRDNTNPPKENLVATLFQNIILLLKDGTDTLFFSTKQLFLDNLQNIRAEDARDVLLGLLNWTIKKLAEDEFKYSKEAFAIYKIGITQHLLCTNEQIHEATYLNTVLAGAAQKEFTWLDFFMEQYSDKLVGSSATEGLELAKAFYFFYKQELDAANYILTTHKFKVQIYDINARILSLRIYYELFEQDPTYHSLLHSSLESCTKYLTNKTRISEGKRLPYRNFITVLKAIFAEKQQDHPNKKKELLDLLEQYDFIVARTWLRQRIEVI